MEIKIRKFQKKDIYYKVKWINDNENNKFLHYTLPLREDATLVWFNSIKDREDRLDYTITFDDKPVGLIGLLDIDIKNKKSEFYITIGERNFKGRGIGTIATDLLIKESFNAFKMNKIYLYTEVENRNAQKLFERIGFLKEGLLKEDLIQNRKKIDRYVYGLLVEDYLNKEL